MVSFVDGNFNDKEDLSVPMALIEKNRRVAEQYGFGLVQQRSLSDPIHGSLGPPPGRLVEPTPEMALESELK
jgi:hypothetical protein